ncbi:MULTISPECIES: hemerythrin domain-containing protein [Mycolicibacterium]|uniref:Hemerythrin HHE cation binding domain protein n=2 Tax=Mycolicibacterium TaxID=1866885 RepID=A1TEC3_MYCVP|nr:MULTISPECIES: hemerythrin domain-containing protein [Mycolicibacterium]ABM15523.1 Hemerythrin HHE cation binding domain protein [Mycolicibacterium vanbaalenii PYR-1]MCV7130919.1 hemerythrin domain-containing protein [Mycolicibacterium vanbaalenii PYR-1]MDN4522193.1 hemerythrin domain-containing protein [Mycolicibacterium austroafricanum]QRZ05793.1 hemerythrin domain-containing protein [Mycolicibacterium austroafricanum]QZT55902.1 hemerythrin domain-containing protein [Mycolicibacterium aust
MSTPTIGSARDVVDYLKTQHETIKALFIETLDAADASTRREAFTRLRTMLAVHETAEEMVVHPRVRRKVEGGEQIVDDRLVEEHDAKVLLRDIEKLPIDSAEFSKALIHLQAAVLEHARHEEELEFTALEAAVGDDELAKLADAVEIAERIAPTHPHPGVESAAANFAAGPFASVLDRARDALGAVFAKR